MDPTTEIKARLSIEELVGSYCQLQKKGRNFVCLCPFHSDKHPSLLVSPDKGIAYCFACRGGGDIFSFYQQIEGVDFVQALKDLAERAGVTLPDRKEAAAPVLKDEKDRLRACLEAAQAFFASSLKTSESASQYIATKRGIPALQVAQFELGLAPDSFSATYDHLLKAGFSRSEIVASGLAIQKDLDGKIYDRFRNRLMFPIHDGTGRLVGFGGRTLGDDDAKYINSSDGPLYHKGSILYGLHHAKEALRETKTAVMVEGYFDVLACHRVGVPNVVAVSGTALTEAHVKLLKRTCDTVILCLDQDQAGRAAAERAFLLCSEAGLLVRVVALGQKDPDEAAQSDPEALRQSLLSGGRPYLEFVIEDVAAGGVSDLGAKRSALQRIIPLLAAVQTSTELDHYLARAAAVFGTTTLSLQEDLKRAAKPVPTPVAAVRATPAIPAVLPEEFSRIEATLGLFLVFPTLQALLDELIEPMEGFAAALYGALRKLDTSGRAIDVDTLDLPSEQRERAKILQLFWEHHETADWTENLAAREVRKNCRLANRFLLHEKMLAVKQELVQARLGGKRAEQDQLATQYRQLLQLAQKSQ